MAKRARKKTWKKIAANILLDPWFADLTVDAKLVWLVLISQCDNPSGAFEVNLRQLGFLVAGAGEMPWSVDRVLGAFSDLFPKLIFDKDSGWVYLDGYSSFQGNNADYLKKAEEIRKEDWPDSLRAVVDELEDTLKAPLRGVKGGLKGGLRGVKGGSKGGLTPLKHSKLSLAKLISSQRREHIDISKSHDKTSSVVLTAQNDKNDKNDDKIAKKQPEKPIPRKTPINPENIESETPGDKTPQENYKMPTNPQKKPNKPQNEADPLEVIKYWNEIATKLHLKKTKPSPTSKTVKHLAQKIKAKHMTLPEWKLYLDTITTADYIQPGQPPNANDRLKNWVGSLTWALENKTFAKYEAGDFDQQQKQTQLSKLTPNSTIQLIDQIFSNNTNTDTNPNNTDTNQEETQ